MKRRFLYYSLVAAMTASAVTFSSCNKDDDENTNTTTTTTTTTPEENKEVEKFAVNVNLNGESILSQQVEVGKKISINLDELTKNPLTQEALKGYEILSITKDGKEVSGEVEISAESKFEINAIKYATLEYQLPANGKILHSQPTLASVGLKKTAPEMRTSYDVWIYTTGDNELMGILRTSVGDIVEDYKSINYEYDTKTGEFKIIPKVIIGKAEAKVPVAKVPTEKNYLFKIGDKYYMTTRFTKTNNEAKGYQTEWSREMNRIIARSKDQLVEPFPIEPSSEESTTTEEITITSEKISYTTPFSSEVEATYEYKDGIITSKNGMQGFYDGTYLYKVTAVFDIEDYKPFKTGELADLSGTDFITNYEKIGNNVNIYQYKDGASDYVKGAYDWNTNEQVDNMEWYYTIVEKYKTLPFGPIDYMPIFIFPDHKITYFDELTDLTENDIFTYEGYIVINGTKLPLGN
ncbi:MAG: hypothetical protein II937_03885 [Bacteroidales bacterium]|nr:hypothetical protein [Bacteroidales bacterium]